jgi:hypothetical protein
MSQAPHPVEGEGLEGAWEAAVAGLRSAEAEIAAFEGVEPKGAAFAVQWALDEAYSELGGRRDEAIEQLLLVPAPDLRALAVKLALAVDALAWELPEGEAAMAQVKADAQRLAWGSSQSMATRRD